MTLIQCINFTSKDLIIVCLLQLEIETGRSLKYKEVIHQASSLACGLFWAGVLPGHVIVVVAFNSLEAHLMILASLLVGSVTALVDPSLSAGKE